MLWRRKLHECTSTYICSMYVYQALTVSAPYYCWKVILTSWFLIHVVLLLTPVVNREVSVFGYKVIHSGFVEYFDGVIFRRLRGKLLLWIMLSVHTACFFFTLQFLEKVWWFGFYDCKAIIVYFYQVYHDYWAF